MRSSIALRRPHASCLVRPCPACVAALGGDTVDALPVQAQAEQWPVIYDHHRVREEGFSESDLLLKKKLSHKYGSRLNIGMTAVVLDGMDLTDAQWAVLDPTVRARRRPDGRGRPWTGPRAAPAR